MEICGLALMTNLIISRVYVVLTLYWVPCKVLSCVNLILIDLWGKYHFHLCFKEPMEYKGHVTCPRLQLVSSEDKIQPNPGRLAPLSTLQPPVYPVFIVSSASGWVYKLENFCADSLKYPVYGCAQIQSHWNHCHLPTALWKCSGVLRAQVWDTSYCQGAGLGLGLEGWAVMLCWTRLGEAAAGRGTSMYRAECPDRIREVQMVHLSCRIFSTLGHFRKCLERKLWLSIGFSVSHI